MVSGCISWLATVWSPCKEAVWGVLEEGVVELHHGLWLAGWLAGLCSTPASIVWL